MLYIVATPIGNLEDITYRAVRVLGEADLVLCEDTRMTRKLLEHYGIETPTQSYHSHSGLKKVEEIIAMLADGKTLALVSDAGTPGIADPGGKLVAEVRERLSDTSIVAVPGPSAVTAALSIAGVPANDFTFFGFLPHKKGRQTTLREIAASERTAVFFESPHRILKTLDGLEAAFGESARQVMLVRELTKVYEEVLSGTPRELREILTTREEKQRGEFVGIIPPRWVSGASR